MSLNKVLALFFFFIWFSLVTCAQGENVYDPRGKRNPFFPLVDADGRLLKLDKDEGSSGPFSLEGIIYDKQGRSFVLVNNAVLGIGDEISGYRVLKIKEDSATFIKNGESFEVELIKGEEK